MKPTLITISEMREKTKGKKTLVSLTFIATFADGSQKWLNNKKWWDTNVLKSKVDETFMVSREHCVLYYRDWDNMPTRGKWDEDYPKLYQTNIPTIAAS